MVALWLAACFPADRNYPVWVNTGDTADTGAPPTETADTATDTGLPGTDTDTEIPGLPTPIGIGFVGFVSRVDGTPFGFDASLEEAVVSGGFTYDRSVVDRDPDPTVGDFPHLGGTGPFELFVDTHAIRGSGNPEITVDADTDTFLFTDGSKTGDPGGVDRRCTFDDVPDDAIQVSLSLRATDAFANDRLPPSFPLLGLDLEADVTVEFTVFDDDDALTLELSLLAGEPAP